MRHRSIKSFLITLLTVTLFFSSPSGDLFAAKESSAINTKRASKALLEGVRDFFKDLDEYQRLPNDDAKVNYLLTKGQDRIIQKSGELAWDRLKTEMSKVAEAKMREALFKEKLPFMMNKVLIEKMSTSAAWSLANTDIVSKMDTRLNALKTGIVSAKVAVKGLTEWRKTGDIRKGFAAFGKAAADEVMEYLVPGWKLYRVAQGIVEALGNYVTGYAFDTALEAKIKVVLPFPPESNPKAFSEWIQSVNIAEHVDQEWNEQSAYGGWYLKFSLKPKEGEEGGDNMKKAIIAALEKMKADVLAEKSKMEQVEREFEEKIRDLEAKSAEATKQAQATLNTIYEKADPFLKMIEDYKAAAFPNQKKDLEAELAGAEAEMNAVPATVPYQPVDAASILSDLGAALSEIKEDYSSGYDYRKGQELWDHYLGTRKKALAANANQSSDPYTERKRAADLAALAAREGLLNVEASQRCQKMVDGLKEKFETMRQEWERAYADYQAAEEALGDKIQTVLKYPALYGNPEAEISQYCPGHQDRWPEAVVQAIEPLRLYQQDIEKDAMRVSGLQEEHRKHVKDLELVYLKLKGDFERAVQPDYRKIHAGGAWDPESWTAHMHVAWAAEALAPLQSLRDEGEPVVTVYIGDKPWERLKTELDVVKAYEAARRWLSGEVNAMENLERPASLAAAYWRLMDLPELYPYGEESLRRVDMERLGHMKDGKWGATVDPAGSDGAKWIEEMKKAWALREEQVLQAQKVRNAFMAFKTNDFPNGDPSQDKNLDQFLRIPAKIAEYEKILGQESVKFKTARDAAKNNLKIMQEQFENLKREVASGIPSTTLLQKLEAFQKEAVLSRKNTELQVPDETDVIDAMKMIEKELDQMVVVCKARMAMNPPTTPGGGATGGSSGGIPQMPRGNAPVLSGFYKIYDPRLNTHSLQDALGGEVVVTTEDLRSGAIEVTARLSTIERIQTLLVSEDGARTWTETRVNQDVAYRFFPMAEKRYQLVLKIKTTDSEEAMIPFFPNIDAIVYRNITYIDLVKDAVAKIANAYESQNVAAFAELISKDYLGNRIFLEEGVRFDFDMFTDIRLKIFIDRIEHRGDLYLADTHWEKSQSPRKTGLQQMTTGKTVMTFALEEGRLKIKNLRGNLIYATLSPEIAEASGLSQAVVEEIRVAEFERNPVQPGAGETENSGGVGGVASNIQTGNFTLTQTTGMADTAAWNQDFDFATQQVYTLAAFDAGSHDVLRWDGNMNVKAGNGIVDMGAVNINSVTEAPLSGYATTTGAIDGHTYAIQLANGTYALIQSTAWAASGPPYPVSTTFHYRYQRNGTRSFT